MLTFQAREDVTAGWWSERGLLFGDRRLGVFQRRVALPLGAVTVGVHLAPHDHRHGRLIVAVQHADDPLLLLNRSEAWYFANGVHAAALDVVALLASVAAAFELVPQVARLGNNAHASDGAGGVRVGWRDEPASPHWHVLLRAPPGSDFLGVGVPLLGETPIGREVHLQVADAAVYDDAALAKVTGALRRACEVAAQRQTLVFVRHGETFANREGIAQGQHPTLELARLTPEAVAAAAAAGVRLAERFPNAHGEVLVVCSELERARQTAEQLRAGWPNATRPEIRHTPLIVERGLGRFEGHPFPAQLDASEFETMRSMQERCAQFCDTLVAEWLSAPGRVLLVVGHGFCGKQLIAQMLIEPIDAFSRLNNVHQTRLVRETDQEAWQLLDFNESQIW